MVVTATTTELNYVDGVTSAIQTQLDAKTADGDNVNNLVGSTSADTVPKTMVLITTCSLLLIRLTVASKLLTRPSLKLKADD